MNDRAKVARSVARARASPLQSVYDRLPVGFALFGADLQLAAWNARFAVLCDYPRNLVRSGSSLESFLRIDAERGEYGPGPVDALVRQQLAALKRRRRTEREPVRSDGRILRIASERLADGGLLITCEDVSEARRAEERLRLSEERYDVAMRAINEGLYDWDIVNDTVHYSDRVYQAVGLSADDYTTAAGWFERIHPDDQARYRDATRAHLRGETDRFECDYRYRWRDGSWHWARQHGLAVRDASGRAVRLVGSTGDITELKERERELAEHIAEQTAVRDLLEAINRSAFDLDAVLRTLIESAARLCHAERAFIFRRDGDAYRLAVDYGGVTPEFREFIRQHPIREGRDTLVGRTALTKAVVHIEDVLADPEYRWPQSQRMGGQRSMLGVPIVRDDAVVGVIALWKERVDPFTPAQIQLVATFSSQAAIAIENVRLFNETKETLERQTATAEILRVISESPGDLEPVFRAILGRATELCDAQLGIVFRWDGERFYVVATRGEDADAISRWKDAFAAVGRPGPHSGLGRLLVDRQPVHISDILEEAAYREGDALRMQTASILGARSFLAVPLLKNDAVIGAVVIYRHEVRPFSARQIELVKVFADQAVIAIENVRLFQELQTKNRELMDLLEQQTATAEILKVISSSPTDIRPVLRALAENAARLCGTADSFIAMADGPVLRLAASVGPFGRTFGPDMAIPIVRGTASGRAVLDRKTIHVLDLAAEVAVEYPQATEFQRRYGHRSLVATPLTSGDAVLGVINVLRKEVRPFTDRQIALLRTFADQAAIAIKNVRLFNETKEALERQTATAEILKVISSSPTDVGPVFDAIIRSASRLAGGSSVNVSRLAEEKLHLAAYTPVNPAADEVLRSAYPVHISEAGPIAEAVRTRSPSFVGDWEADPGLSRKARETMHARGFRSTLYVPIMHREEVLGLMHVSKVEPGPFPPQWVDLLKTFADQAAIAIENVRLFNETKEALERQTATAEILKVISSSPTDVQPVLDAVAERAGRLCDAPYANVMLAEGGELRVMSVYSTEPGPRPDQRNFVPLRRTFLNARAVLDREVIHIPDVAPLIDTEFPDIRRNQEKFGFRAVLVVPLLREGRAVGTIFLWRREAGPFSDEQVALLKTFADQAVIAIENVRLFNETKEALERQTATADVLASISGSLTDTQPVFERIVKNLRDLFGTRFAVLQLLRGDMVEMPAVYGSPGFERLRERYPRALDDTTVGGRAMLSKQTLQFAPVLDNPATPSATIEFARDFGFNSVIFTPMIHEGAVIGAIGAAHPGAKGFDERQVALLKTFADQAVIAIQNARLFQELQARNRDLSESLEQQTATAEILRVISNSPTDITPVLDAVAENAARLCEANDVVVMMNEGDVLRAVKSSGPFGERFGSGFTIPITRGSAAGRAVIERSTVQVADFESASDEEFPVGREHRRIYGNHGAMATPLVHGDAVLGVIAVLRRDVRPFSDRQRTLLQTFADQAAIAIENVRLFNETKEALEQQTATGEILRVISSSPTDLAPVFDAVAKSVSRLCDAPDVVIVRAEGGSMRFAASVGPFGQTFGRELAVPLARGTVAGRAVLERRTVHVDDLAAEPEDEYPEGKVLQRRYGHRTMMAAPLLLGDTALGAIAVLRKEVRPFSEKQVALLRTFADQSVIAIENVRLFNETKEALEKQTAISEILRVISASPTDVQPVFDAIVRSAVILCGSKDGAVFRYDGERLHYAAGFDQTPEWVDAVQSRYPMHPETSTIAGRAILTLSVAQIDDVLADPAYDHERAIKGGWRRMLAVPMLREGVPLGVIVVSWPQPGPTPKSQEELLKTFADQAVIAIENVRLFNEIRDKSHQLEIANQHKSAFLANMSHELRTPLNAVIGFSEMLAARYFGDLTEKQAEYVNDIHGSGKHLLSLINDILDLSKIEAGRMELEAVEFDLRAALENAITLVRERAQRGGVALRLDTGPELGAFRGDERKLKQVVLNLLSNAVKFTPRGGAVDVSARRADGAVEIAVRDSGAGIAPEDHEAIFEAFRQVGTDATRKREGTGLGLALTRRFVELHGGTIRVESAVGKGSTFTVRLPTRHGE